jgi:hypothetical protein
VVVFGARFQRVLAIKARGESFRIQLGLTKEDRR